MYNIAIVKTHIQTPIYLPIKRPSTYLKLPPECSQVLVFYKYISI